MKREFINVQEVELYTRAEWNGTSGYHFPDKDGELVRVSKKDGKSLEKHLEGIKYIRKLIRNGVKILPPLVQRKRDGTLHKLDGFKRLKALQEEGVILAEAFVCNREDMGKKFTYTGLRISGRVGGQPYGRFPNAVEYGEDEFQVGKGGKILYLFKGKNLRLEYRENIHMHWGPKGRSRLALGRRDFDLLAEAFDGCRI